MKTSCMDHIVWEATEVGLHPYNINREGAFCLSKSWKPLIGSLGHDPDTLGVAGPYPKPLLCKQPHPLALLLPPKLWNLAL
jgi:hypothetical protein